MSSNGPFYCSFFAPFTQCVPGNRVDDLLALATLYAKRVRMHLRTHVLRKNEDSTTPILVLT